MVGNGQDVAGIFSSFISPLFLPSRPRMTSAYAADS
jgi:hypothetical protein